MLRILVCGEIKTNSWPGGGLKTSAFAGGGSGPTLKKSPCSIELIMCKSPLSCFAFMWCFRVRVPRLPSPIASPALRDFERLKYVSSSR